MRRIRTAIGILAATLLFSACAHVEPHVSLPVLALGEPSFFPTLEAYASAPIVGGNSVEILLNGEHSFPAQLALIRSATKTITYEQYFYADGPISRDMAEAFAERCRAGVGVNILLDAFGSIGIPGDYVNEMKDSGCHVAWFRPLHRLWPGGKVANRNHRRSLVVDGRVAITGGTGISAKWMGDGRTEDHWRDTDIKIEGPAVTYIQGTFAENWLRTTGMVLGGEAYFPSVPTPKGQAHVQVVRASPAEGDFAIYTAFLLAISSARKSIMVTNPYFVLNDKMTEAILTAVRNGAKVTVLVPGKIDHNLVRTASRADFGPLLKAGVEIYEYKAALLHAKTMVIDGVWATIGSTNLDNTSFALNDEMNVIVYNRAIAERLEEVYREDLRHASKITYEQWAKRGAKERFIELIALPIRDLL